MRAGSGPSSSATGSPAPLLGRFAFRRGLDAFGFALDLGLFVGLDRLVRHRFDVCRLATASGAFRFDRGESGLERDYLDRRFGCASGGARPAALGSRRLPPARAPLPAPQLPRELRPARAPLPSPARRSPLLPPQPLRRGWPARPRTQTLPTPGRALPSTAPTQSLRPVPLRRGRVYLASDSPGSTKKSSCSGSNITRGCGGASSTGAASGMLTTGGAWCRDSPSGRGE